MTKRDRTAIMLRNLTLIIVLAIVANMWRNPVGTIHLIEIAVIVALIMTRERVSYYWHKPDRTLWGNNIGEDTQP